MNTHGQGIPGNTTHASDGGIENPSRSGSEDVSGLLRQVPVLRWMLVLCGVLGVSLAACLLMHPRTAAIHGSIGSTRCGCRQTGTPSGAHGAPPSQPVQSPKEKVP